MTVVAQIAEAARLETNEVVAHSVTREVVRSETKEAAPEIVTETIAFHEARTVEVTTDEVKEVMTDVMAAMIDVTDKATPILEAVPEEIQIASKSRNFANLIQVCLFDIFTTSLPIRHFEDSIHLSNKSYPV